MTTPKLRAYHAAVWDEPVVMAMGRPGARGQVFPAPEPEVAAAVGAPAGAIPAAMRREAPPALPEITEFEAQRHYLHLSQMTLGMMGVSLFGTCTMKYNAKVSELATNRPELAEVHPLQHEDTLQGTLGILHRFDLILRSLSGMDRFVFQAGGGADAAYMMAALARAYWAAKGELATRDEVVTSIQAHPCNAATAAAAGFKVITLPLEENGYPSLAALEAAIGPRTALLMINNPDDMGIYNPDIKEWVAGGQAGRGLVLLRPRQLQRRDGPAVGGRARLRCLHVHAAQDFRRAQGRRRPCRRRLRLHRGAGARSCRPRWWSRTAAATGSTRTARCPAARSASSGATCPRW